MHPVRTTTARGCLMDKWGVEVDMWTSLQNAQLDHIPTSPTPLTHKGYAFGLTRFACQTAIFKKSKIPNTKSKKTRGKHTKLQKHTIAAAQ